MLIPKVHHLDICFAVDNHYDFDQGHRTAAGSLVYAAKDYGEDGHGEVGAADRLANIVAYWAAWIRDQDRWNGAEPDLVVPIPSHRQRRPHNLPDVLAHESPWVRWRLQTLETRMESCQERQSPGKPTTKSVHRGGEGPGGAAGAPAAWGAGDRAWDGEAGR